MAALMMTLPTVRGQYGEQYGGQYGSGYDEGGYSDPLCENTCLDLKDHFETLNVDEAAVMAEHAADPGRARKSLKKACRDELKRYHPDKQLQSSAEEKTAAVNRYLEVEEACRGLGCHRGDDDGTPAHARLTDYVALKKICADCVPRQPATGFGGLGQMAFDMVGVPSSLACRWPAHLGGLTPLPLRPLAPVTRSRRSSSTGAAGVSPIPRRRYPAGQR